VEEIDAGLPRIFRVVEIDRPVFAKLRVVSGPIPSLEADYSKRKRGWPIATVESEGYAARKGYPRYRYFAAANLNAASVHNLLQDPSAPEPKTLAEGFPDLSVWRKYTDIFSQILDRLVSIFQPTHDIIAIVSTQPKINHDLACAAVYRSHQSDLHVQFFQVRLVDTHGIEPDGARLRG
jgi:hypothetical protein